MESDSNGSEKHNRVSAWKTVKVTLFFPWKSSGFPGKNFQYFCYACQTEHVTMIRPSKQPQNLLYKWDTSIHSKKHKNTESSIVGKIIYKQELSCFIEEQRKKLKVIFFKKNIYLKQTDQIRIASERSWVNVLQHNFILRNIE